MAQLNIFTSHSEVLYCHIILTQYQKKLVWLYKLNVLYPLMVVSVLDGGKLQQGISCQRKHPCWELHLFYRYSTWHNSVRINTITMSTVSSLIQWMFVFLMKIIEFFSGPSASCSFRNVAHANTNDVRKILAYVMTDSLNHQDTFSIVGVSCLNNILNLWEGIFSCR